MALRYDTTQNQYVRGADVTDYAADGAITAQGGIATLSNPSAAGAYTLGPPAAGDEGNQLTLTATTAFAHVVTLTEGIAGRGALFDTLTFGGNVGDTIVLRAVQLHWIMAGTPNGVTIE